MNHRAIYAFTGIIALAAGCAGVEKPPVREVYTGPFLVSAEDPIQGIPSEVEYADYWVRKAPDPDGVILTPEQIEAFNRGNPLQGSVMFDIPSLSAQSRGERIREYLSANARYIIETPFFVTGDIPLEKAERHRIAALMDTAGVPDTIDIRFGVMLERASGKLWPTSIPLMTTPGDNEFDHGMVSTVDMGDPVALLHTSRDGLWCYVQTENFPCWVPSSTVAFGALDIVLELVERSSPLVVIGDRVAVYGNPDDKSAVGCLPMGTYLPIRSVGNSFCEVLVPGRGPRSELVVKRGYIRRGSDVSIGFLPYTLRNVYRQCFILYGARYGWGGDYDSRDCSSYILFPEQYNRVVALAASKKCRIILAEQRLLNTDHCMVGKVICELWNLPEDIVNAVFSHNNPAENNGDHSQLIRLIHLSDILARSAGIGDPGDSIVPEPSPTALSLLGASQERNQMNWQAILAELEATRPDIDGFFSELNILPEDEA